jgi:hypothetical protein
VPHSWTAADHVFARVDDVESGVAVGVDDESVEQRN